MADWLIPALVSSIASNGLLTILHLLIWSQYRNSYLLHWAAAWGTYVLVLILILVRVKYGPSLLLYGAQYSVALVSAFFLLVGTKKFINESLNGFWKLLGQAGIGWIIVSLTIGIPPTVCAALNFILIGTVQIYTGIIILIKKKNLGFPSLWAGLCLILWGIHRADYPFLKDIAWFAPWGFLLAAVLTITVSMNLILMFLEQIKSNLQSAQNTLKTILGVAPVGIGMVKDHYLAWNNVYLDKLLGHEPGYLTGRSPMSQHYDQNEFKQTYPGFVKTMLKKGTSREEIILRHKDGHPVPIEITGQLIKPGQPEHGMIVALADLTQRTRSENALRELAAGVAHNFNNLLMAISSNAEAAKHTLPPKDTGGHEAHALLENIIKASLSGKDISRRLAALVASKNQISDKSQVLDLNEPLTTALDLATAANPELGTSIKVTYQVPKPLMVRGVQGHLVEVFQNLIANALDAMQGAGSLTFWTQIRQDSLTLFIRDSGKGMDSATAAKAFDPFYSTKGTQGRGLGLTASLGIIRAHGGDLQLNSRPYRGTVAIVSLPLISAVPLPAGSDAGQAPLKTTSILLVEDEAMVALGIEAILQNAGHKVDTASRLSQAREALDHNSYGLVLSDLGLPDGTGWDLALYLGSKPEPRPPLVFLTGITEFSRRDLPQAAVKPAAVLQKPIDKNTLLAEISKAL